MSDQTVTFTPYVVDNDYVVLMLKPGRCGNCNKIMLPDYNGLAKEPGISYADFLKALDAVPFHGGSWEKRGEKYVYFCEECSKTLLYECVICGKSYPLAEMEESGDRRKGMCEHCYSTVPARKWDDALSDFYHTYKDYGD